MATYWLDVFTAETWREFREHGSTVSGFGKHRAGLVKKIKPGDLLLCYITGSSRWVGLLEVTGPSFLDHDVKVWSKGDYPCRLPVRAVIELDPEHGVPVLDMKDELTVFKNLSNPNRWSGAFRTSPSRWKPEDGDAVHAALAAAHKDPVFKAIKGQPGPPVPVVATDDGVVSIPEDDELESGPAATKHTEIQYRLLRLGAEMGFDVWVASNDQSRVWDDKKLSDLPRRRDTVPGGFDTATTDIIKLIDVLWLDKNSIAAAFEIESTTSIYSGLLRMSDLVAMQPNISIPLFIVAPAERRAKVMREVQRPTFERRQPPLSEICRFIPFEDLTKALEQLRGFVKVLKADFLQQVSESCEPPVS